jgi:signal transduction histidine kinase
MFEELSLHILDIAMNSLAAGARIVSIVVHEDRAQNELLVQIRDDGHGMDEATLHKVLTRSTTSKTSRKKSIGLGLALLRQTAEMCAGKFRVESKVGVGTAVTATMQLSHIDRPPVGDLNSTILSLCAAAPTVDVRLSYRSDEGSFEFSSQELQPQ